MKFKLIYLCEVDRATLRELKKAGGFDSYEIESKYYDKWDDEILLDVCFKKSFTARSVKEAKKIAPILSGSEVFTVFDEQGKKLFTEENIEAVA